VAGGNDIVVLRGILADGDDVAIPHDVVDYGAFGVLDRL